jgi:tetratricopeptide (TPR) repeat protein
MADEVVPSASDEEHSAQVEAAWADAAVGEDEVSETVADSSTSWWSRLFARIFGESGPSSERLERLDQAIVNQPNAAANYVLRGELYLQAGEPELAVADFERALDLASEQFGREDWGVLSQVMRDQAERGLELALRRLKKR